VIIIDKEIATFGRQHDLNFVIIGVFLEDRQRCLFHPAWKLLVDCFTPPSRFRIGCGQRRIALRQMRNDPPDIMGNIDIFRKPLDYAIPFGKRRSSLKDKMLTGPRREESFHGPDHHHVFLKEMNRPPRFGGGHA
jgi:hypothetical protein